jgi:hypothetical protein
MSLTKCNLGFGNSVFLTESEWKTFLKRKPVRFIKKKHTDFCAVCGLSATIQNPFQHSHIIPFDMGIVDLALTPDFLDNHQNIVSAHRSICNKQVELSIKEAVDRLKSMGLILPNFLPTRILEIV